MNEKSHQDNLKNPSRREFLRGTGGAAIGSTAVVGGLIIGKIVANTEVQDHPEVNMDEFKSVLSELYGMHIAVDVWPYSHIPVKPRNPQNTLLIGEFTNQDLTRSRDYSMFPAESSRSHGDRTESLSAAQIKLVDDVISSVSVVLATDNRGQFINEYILYDTRDLANPYEYLGLLNTVIGIGIPSALLLYSNFKKINDEQDKLISRREFLRHLGVFGGSVAAGAATSILKTESHLKKITDADMELIIKDQPDYMQDILRGHNPLNEWLLDVRNRNMLLRSVAFSTVNLRDKIPDLQYSLANGHIETFNLIRDIPNTVLLTENKINETLQFYIELLKRYERRWEEVIGAIASATAIDLSMYEPLSIRVNYRVKEGVDMQYVKSRISSETICPEPFLILCRTISKFINNLDPSSSDFNFVRMIFDFLKLKIQHQPINNVQEGYEYDYAGNKYMVDEVIKLFGREYRFSSGLFASMD